MKRTSTHLKPIFILFILIATALSCSVINGVSEKNYHLKETPPNGVKVSANFYCDKTEMNNLGWLEYLYWKGRIFGVNSVEYRAAMPDTMVWTENYSCLDSYVDYYLRHPGKLNNPVVGVSQEQALEYSKWRSDRVFEVLLTKLKKIERDTIQNKDSYFTIERYFNDTFGMILSGEKVEYYPDFRLPTLAERQSIMHYADAVDEAYFEKCNSKYCQECMSDFPQFQSDIIPCAQDTFKVEPTVYTDSNCSAKNGDPIFNLRGNVGEWSAEEGITLGGGWHDKREQILQSDTFHIDKQNAWTGFRNVCEWKKWEE